MTEKKNKATFSDKMKMDTQVSCEAAIKNGWCAALLSLVITLAFSCFGFFVKSDDETLNYLLDPWLLVDVVLLAIMAFFIYKKSRIAATLMFIYFVVSKITLWYELGAVQGLPLTMIFLFFYVNAMRGTFVWHSKYKNPTIEDESFPEASV